MSSQESMPRAVRRRAREEIVRQIVEAARRQLATEGAPALSLRAVARELGMVSSAVYRYVASRDDLLTLLLVEGYDALGAAAEDAEGQVPRADLAGRWLAICHGVRDWATSHPHEYALLYGSPVPGYAAPETTIGPSTRVPTLLSRLMADSLAGGTLDESMLRSSSPESAPWRVSMRPLRPFVPLDVPDEFLIRGLMAWTHLLGTLSFEIFGHLHNVVEEDPDLRRAYFAEQMSRIGELAGLARR